MTFLFLFITFVVEEPEEYEEFVPKVKEKPKGPPKLKLVKKSKKGDAYGYSLIVIVCSYEYQNST